MASAVSGDRGAEERTAKMQALRGLLAEKFPEQELKDAGLLPTGLAAFDAAEGGLRRGAVTELVAATSGGALFIEVMLAALGRQQGFGALVDLGGSFDPQGASSGLLSRLLWVRCQEALQAVKAADLLLRDGNLALILLDFQAAPLREIRRIPASTWHRFQRLAEPASTALVILTTQPLVEGARARIVLRERWTLRAMRERRGALLQQLEPQVQSRRHFPVLVELERRTA
jgi:hypothetical protein